MSRVRSLKPRRILEIGCGNGLLLTELAAGCDLYRGTDLSGEAIESLRQWLTQRNSIGNIQLERCSALEAPASGEQYDTVVLH
ncbi:class I SAM-dependent methyltransferase, partial [Klebsiella pneumoniae]